MEIEKNWRRLVDQMAVDGSDRLLIRCDLNANMGRGNVRRGDSGKFGIGRMNDAGKDL